MPNKIEPVQALDFMLNNNFTRAQYEGVHSQSIVEGADKREIGLVVDHRQEGGFRITNTGNVVRKAFANAEKTAEICGVSTMLASNLDVMHCTLASGQDIHPEKFEAFLQRNSR